jgi:hypothetical protein
MAIQEYVLIAKIPAGQKRPKPLSYFVADTEAELPATAKVGDLCFAKDTNKLMKYHGSTWNDSAGQSGGGIAFREFTIAASGWAWANQPLALTEIGGGTDFRSKADLTQFTQVRHVMRIPIAGAAAAVMRIQYSLDETSWFDLTPNSAINTPGTKVSAWTDIPANAKADVTIRIVGEGGNGTADPRMGTIVLQAK